MGKNVVCDTECSPERVALQMPGSIAQECAGASLATAGVSTQEWGSLCVWRRWVRTSWEAVCRRPWVALSGLRAWPWVVPESGLREAFVKRGVQRLWSATRGLCMSSVCVCQWHVSTGPLTVTYARVGYGRRQGLEQTVSALWVKGELGKFSRHIQHSSDEGITQSTEITKLRV